MSMAVMRGGPSPGARKSPYPSPSRARTQCSIEPTQRETRSHHNYFVREVRKSGPTCFPPVCSRRPQRPARQEAGGECGVGSRAHSPPMRESSQRPAYRFGEGRARGGDGPSPTRSGDHGALGGTEHSAAWSLGAPPGSIAPEQAPFGKSAIRSRPQRPLKTESPWLELCLPCVRRRATRPEAARLSRAHTGARVPRLLRSQSLIRAGRTSEGHTRSARLESRLRRNRTARLLRPWPLNARKGTLCQV